ncbi:MAG: reverse transcriptase family protein, partial [bacterium]
GKFRFTIDFRELNDATVATPWQMPDVESQLARLAHKKIFGCIDLSSYYHQIELDIGSRYLTGFVTEDGVFEYQRVPMGLKNACAHAQSELQKAIDCDPILSKYGLRNYFDDLPLAAKSEAE